MDAGEEQGQPSSDHQLKEAKLLGMVAGLAKCRVVEAALATGAASKSTAQDQRKHDCLHKSLSNRYMDSWLDGHASLSRLPGLVCASHVLVLLLEPGASGS